MELHDDREMAFEFAKDSTKQLITLGTVIVTATIAVAGAFSENLPEDTRPFIIAMWLTYVISIIAGAATLLALTGTLEPLTKDGEEGSAEPVSTAETQPSTRGTNVTTPSKIQVVTFLLGTILAAVTGAVAVY